VLSKQSGVNLMPFLTGENSGAPHDYLFWRMFDKEHAAVRSGSDKLVTLDPENDTSLYRISDDIDESSDISNANPERTDLLDKKLKEWSSQLKPAIFDPLGTWDPSVPRE
jgi:hypothetical protein